MKKAIYPLLLLGTFCVSLIHGQSLAEWSLDIDASPSNVSANVTAEDLARGGGIGVLDFGGAGASANAWESSLSISAADYFEVCLSPNAGYGLLVDGLDFIERRSSDGVRSYDVRWSLDGFETSTLVASSSAASPPPGNVSYGPDKINVRVCEGETLCIRWYGFRSDNYAGKWSLEDIKVLGSASPACTPPPTPPSDLQVANITNNSMSLSWTKGANADNSLTDNTIILARKNSVVKATLCSGNTYTADATFGTGDFVGDSTYVVYNGPDKMVTVDGLEELETYHFQAVGYNTALNCYQIANLPKTFQTTLCGTLPLEVNGLVSSSLNDSIALAWGNPNCFDEVLVVASTASVTGTPASTTGLEYQADANYGDGTDGLGDFSAPEFPVFKGTGDRVLVTGLTINTTYYFKVFVRLGSSWSAGVEVARTSTEGCPELGGDVVFINELHYRNSGVADVDEGVEIAGPAGIDLSNYELYFYVTGGELDKSFLPEGVLRLYGVIDDEGQGYGAMWFPVPGLRNAAALALYNEVTGHVIEFLSFRADDIKGEESVAKDSTSTCLGKLSAQEDCAAANEGFSTEPFESLQRIGNGSCPSDLLWGEDPMPSSRGSLNALQQVLPIELIYFRGEAVAERVLLSWQTLSEQNNDYMAVEHSTDAKNFREVGQLKGAGTITAPQSYQLWHDSPRPGVNYYRLRQVDFDGTASYHGVIAVYFKGGRKELLLYPTPTSGLLTVELPEAREERTELAIYDMQGRILHRILLESSSQREEVSVEELPPGPYFLQWRNGAGEVLNRRFVKY